MIKGRHDDDAPADSQLTDHDTGERTGGQS